jgi:hypothetical protein
VLRATHPDGPKWAPALTPCLQYPCPSPWFACIWGGQIPGTRALTNTCSGAVPLGNWLERLYGDRKGQHSIRINEQFRGCFRWEAGYADDVEIINYH